MTLIDDMVDSFFPNDVAVDATYTPDAGQPASVRVIFDRNYFQDQGIGDIGVETSNLAITVKTEDFENCKQGESIVINGTTYYLLNPQISIGVSLIILSKDPV